MYHTILYIMKEVLDSMTEGLINLSFRFDIILTVEKFDVTVSESGQKYYKNLILGGELNSRQYTIN